jgi:hypothetical protein
LMSVDVTVLSFWLERRKPAPPSLDANALAPCARSDRRCNIGVSH